MKIRMSIVLVLVLMTVNAVARSFTEGHLIMMLTDKELRPITNATVCVKTLNRTGLTAGVYPGHYTTFSAQTDTNGVADVSFQFLVSHFTWWLDTPSHHSEEIGFQSDHFSPTIVRSDYWDSETNTVEGLARYNELKALDEAGNHVAYAEKFQHKSVTYVSNTVHKSLSFYPKRNPQPMYAYGQWNRLRLPMTGVVVHTNGYAMTVYPQVAVDLKEGALLPPHNGGDVPGKVADFTLERYSVVTNGVKSFFGKIVFSPGCGAYKGFKTDDMSFPSVYSADENETYANEIDFHISRDVSTGETISCKQLVDTNEYLVVRSRCLSNSNGSPNGWHYSKILGRMCITSVLSVSQSVFNPQFNDTNLEFDVKENLAGSRGESRWP